MPFKIVRNDITKMQVDAIVNTANEAPMYGAGVDTAVYLAAGEDELLAERKKIGWLQEGDVAITPGFKLPAKYIIHAVSPCYIDGTFHEEKKIRACYTKSLYLAHENNCESIAFPLVSTGSFGYPKEEGMRIALDEINAFLMKHTMMVYLVVFDKTSVQLGKSLYPELEAYIDQNYVQEKKKEEYQDSYFCSVSEGTREYPTRQLDREYIEKLLARRVEASEVRTERQSAARPMSVPQKVSRPKEEKLFAVREEEKILSVREMDNDSFEDFLEAHEAALNERMKHLSDTFQQYLLFLMEQKKLTPAEVYKRALITKQLFSKIKVNKNYHPDKATAMRLCIGAQLNIDEAKDLLGRAGYALSPCDKRDIIFSFFIENKVYDMIELDIALEEHGLPCFIE